MQPLVGGQLERNRQLRRVPVPVFDEAPAEQSEAEAGSILRPLRAIAEPDRSRVPRGAVPEREASLDLHRRPVMAGGPAKQDMASAFAHDLRRLLR